MSKTTNTYSPEVRERAVRMVFDYHAEHASQWAAILSIAPKIGCNPETLRSWVRQAERDQGLRAGQRIADALDVVLDRGELGLLVIDHRADAVIQDRFDLEDVGLQRVNGVGVVFGGHADVPAVVAQCEKPADDAPRRW